MWYLSNYYAGTKNQKRRVQVHWGRVTLYLVFGCIICARGDDPLCVLTDEWLSVHRRRRAAVQRRVANVKDLPFRACRAEARFVTTASLFAAINGRASAVYKSLCISF